MVVLVGLDYLARMLETIFIVLLLEGELLLHGVHEVYQAPLLCRDPLAALHLAERRVVLDCADG